MVGNKITKSDGKYKVYYKDGNTQDIMRVVMEAVNDKKILKDTQDFSKDVAISYAGLRQLWHFTKDNIKYWEDPDGFQWIRDPNRSWDDRKKGIDCKSFTVFLSSIFQNLGLKHVIRFAAYKGKVPTHVYPVVFLNGRWVVMDCVHTKFDSEVSYSYKKDFTIMPEIARLSGFDSDEIAGLDDLQQHIDGIGAIDVANMSEGEFFRRVYADTYGGIIAADIEKGHSTIPLVNAFIQQTQAMTKPAVSGFEDSIGANAVTKALDKVKKGLLSWLIQTGLPSSAPFFLFTFLKRPVNSTVDAKKAKQEHILAWIGRNTHLDKPKIEALLRQGIYKKYKKQPEQILNETAKSSVSGIGIIPIPIDALAKVVQTIIEKVASLFKKKDAPKVDKSDGSNLALLAFTSPENKPLVTTPNVPQGGWKGTPYPYPDDRQVNAANNASPGAPPAGNQQIIIYDKTKEENPVLLDSGGNPPKWYEDKKVQIGLAAGTIVVIGGILYYFKTKN